MDKRHFLGAAALATAGAAIAAPARPNAGGPALLTISGAIGKPNRGALDPALDQMMHKQKITFPAAHAFDFSTLAAMPALAIRPTLEYDNRQHSLRGPLLTDVLARAGAQLSSQAKLLLRAVDGYVAAVTPAQANAWRFIVATHLDGKPMPLGGLGPLWAVYDADRVPEMAARPVAERFGACPWALYHIEVQA
ncbi:molybdopterin-dependent oxidoreductase [Massilia sp. GCM10020059]|uniref:Molybdopterin-dependent oxidoreductase n=1 Tax=Massilia agrisoli TaxID=2892444 RepID=A0ABS8ISK2_9BURK|nr:molybdopterin-dependent oxidoreductase [Massilia agrisoli]MCC6070234.1 molybdopterin-dependent oxidoreductase [Massilia agrisoli]